MIRDAGIASPPTIARLTRFDAIAEAVVGLVDRHAGASMIAVSLAVLAAAWARSAAKPLWFDEVITLRVSSLPTLPDVWRALSIGADTNPPLFHVLTRTARLVAGPGPLGLRLPEIVGFWLMTVCLYRFVSRSLSPAWGVAAAMLPSLTRAFDYAYEARPYGLILGLCGLSLVCWQQTASTRRGRAWVVALATTLVVAIAIHVYAVFLLVPLAAGEIVRAHLLGRSPWPVLVACGLAGCTLVVWLPVLRAAGAYSAAFWSPAAFAAIPAFYEGLLAPAVFPIFLVGLLVSVASVRPWAAHGGGDRIEGQRPGAPRVPAWDAAAAIGLALLPVLVVLSGVLMTGAFIDRYALPAVAGVALLFVFAATAAAQPRVAVAALLVVLAPWFAARHVAALVRAARAEPASVISPLLTAGPLPVVDEDPISFLQVAHYAPPALAGRIYYLADVSEARRLAGADSAERSILALAAISPLQVAPYAGFVHEHPRFLLYTTDRRWSWLRGRLTADRARIELTAHQGREELFVVSMPDGPKS